MDPPRCRDRLGIDGRVEENQEGPAQVDTVLIRTVDRCPPTPIPLSPASAILLAVSGVAVAAVGRLRPGLVPVRAGAGLLGTLAIWGALLRLPIYGLCSLLFAAGLGRLFGGAVAAHALRPARLRWVLAALLVGLGVLAAGSS